MDGAGFKAWLKLLGRTQVVFAEENNVALRTVHNWASVGPPEEVVRLLELMTRLERPFAPSEAGNGSKVFDRLIAAELDRLAAAAGTDRRSEFVRGVERWLDANKAL